MCNTHYIFSLGPLHYEVDFTFMKNTNNENHTTNILSNICIFHMLLLYMYSLTQDINIPEVPALTYAGSSE